MVEKDLETLTIGEVAPKIRSDKAVAGIGQ